MKICLSTHLELEARQLFSHEDASDVAHVLPSSSATLGKDTRVPSVRKRARITENTAALRGRVHRSFHFHTSSRGIVSARAAATSWQLSRTGCNSSSKAGTAEESRKPYSEVGDAPLTVRLRGRVDLVKHACHDPRFLFKCYNMFTDRLCQYEYVRSSYKVAHNSLLCAELHFLVTR